MTNKIENTELLRKADFLIIILKIFWNLLFFVFIVVLPIAALFDSFRGHLGAAAFKVMLLFFLLIFQLMF